MENAGSRRKVRERMEERNWDEVRGSGLGQKVGCASDRLYVSGQRPATTASAAKRAEGLHCADLEA